MLENHLQMLLVNKPAACRWSELCRSHRIPSCRSHIEALWQPCWCVDDGRRVYVPPCMWY